MKKIIFYSSVRDKTLFKTQKFYQIDIEILQGLGYNVVLSNKITDAICFWRYDIVFAYFFRLSLFFAIIARIFGKKCFFTGGIDALDIDSVGVKQYQIQKYLFKLCYLFSTKCIIVSSEDLKHVKQIVGEDATKIVYSEHSIDTHLFKTDISFSDKQNNFITIGWQGSKGNIQRKGIDKAICLFSKLIQYEAFSSSKLFILGRKGEGTVYLESLIKRLNLQNKVTLTGEVTEDQKISFLKQNRYYFQLSSYEGFGIAALEALVAGNLILHSGKGGLNNTIYEHHVLVNIDSDITAQGEEVYHKLIDVNYELLRINSVQSCKYYDNFRRSDDFRRIIGSI